MADEKVRRSWSRCLWCWDPALTEKDILAHCKANLTGWAKVPKFDEFRDELPKTNVGKILRRPCATRSPA